jgi:hypothetical protein
MSKKYMMVWLEYLMLTSKSDLMLTSKSDLILNSISELMLNKLIILSRDFHIFIFKYIIHRFE